MHTVQEVAERLGISPWSVSQLMKKNRMPYVQVGRRKRMSPEMIDAWIAKNTNSGEGLGKKGE